MTEILKEVVTQSAQLVVTIKVREIGHRKPAWVKVLVLFVIQLILVVGSSRIRIPKVMLLITTTLLKVFITRLTKARYL